MVIPESLLILLCSQSLMHSDSSCLRISFLSLSLKVVYKEKEVSNWRNKKRKNTVLCSHKTLKTHKLSQNKDGIEVIMR